MREDVFWSMLQALWRLVIFAIPRLFARIKQYFDFSDRTYRKVKRKVQSSNLPVIIYDNGERQHFSEFIGKVKYYGVPYALWFGLCILAPAMVLVIIYIAVMKSWGYFALGFFLICMVLSWLSDKDDENKWRTKQVLEQMRLNVRDILFNVLLVLGALIPIKPLNVAGEINVKIRQRLDGIVIVSALVLKSSEIMQNELEKIKAQIQVTLNKYLLDGSQPGFPCYSYDTTATDDRDRVYTLVVDSIKDAGVELEIIIIIADNQRAIEYVRSKRTPPPSNPGQGNDRDF